MGDNVLVRLTARAPKPAGPRTGLFSQSGAGESKHDQAAQVDEAKHVAPIPLPESVESGSGGGDAPLLDLMKRTREDPTKFEEYMKSRPDELSPTDEAFSRIPVESIGRAMLEGMGYKEDEDTVKPFIFEGRPALLGLGAKAKPQDGGRNQKNKRAFITLGSVGQIGGTHRFGVVTQVDGVPGLDMIRVRIFKVGTLNGETEIIEVPRSGFALVRDIDILAPEHPARRILAECDRIEKEQESLRSMRDNEQNKRQKTRSESTWLRTGLRVLIVDDRDPELYKKKGIVEAIDEDGRATIRLEKDMNNLVDRVKEKYLQTVVPDTPGTVLVIVRGSREYNGRRVKLLERDKRKGVALVSIEGKREAFPLDDLCELIE